MKHLIEVNSYEFEGIKVTVKIDRIAGKVSVGEIFNSSGEYQFRNKSFLFAGRELGYMQSWQTILSAVKYAIGQAEIILKEDAEEERKRREDLLMEMAMQDRSK